MIKKDKPNNRRPILQELSPPIKVTCAKCGAEALIIPIPSGRGIFHKGKCTFGQEKMTIIQMLVFIFGGNHQ